MDPELTFSAELVTNTAHLRYGKPWQAGRCRLRARGIKVDSCIMLCIDIGDVKNHVVCEMVLSDGKAVAFTVRRGFWRTSIVEWHEIPAAKAMADQYVMEARTILADGHLAEFDLAVKARAQELVRLQPKP